MAKQLHNDDVSLQQFGKTQSELLEELMTKKNFISLPSKKIREVWKRNVNLSSKPKNIDKMFFKMKDEIDVEYGDKLGNTVMNIICDLVEGEFYKVNNGNFKKLIDIQFHSSKNKWQKSIKNVNHILNNDFDIQISLD